MPEEKSCNEYTIFENKHDLIVTIVKKGLSEKIIEATKKAGAEGGTIIFGRGTGIHEKAKLLGIPIEPEKEIIFTVAKKKITKDVLDSIVSSVNLNKPGTGIAFVIELSKVLGICHFNEIE
ncbi:MAG: P-II family nitrogen regulator [Actinomycetota bacterium]|jgi:nitrogen regulatory protein PII|nr:P-II family nitrogen regulator [Actinomycetota bacterium]